MTLPEHLAAACRRPTDAMAAACAAEIPRGEIAAALQRLTAGGAKLTDRCHVSRMEAEFLRRVLATQP